MFKYGEKMETSPLSTNAMNTAENELSEYILS